MRELFETVTTGIKGAIDFLRKNLGIAALSNLSYDNILVPLSVFFAGLPTKQHHMTNTQRSQILRWFWRTCFGHRLNPQPIKTLREDVTNFQALEKSTSKSCRSRRCNWIENFSKRSFSG